MTRAKGAFPGVGAFAHIAVSADAELARARGQQAATRKSNQALDSDEICGLGHANL